MSNKVKKVKGKSAEEVAKEIYEIGIKNGKIIMKNKILKTLNRDFKFFFKKYSPTELLDKINLIK
jgi:hypothetical protein